MGLEDQDPQDETTTESGSTQEFNWDADDNPYKKRFEDFRSGADRVATKLSQYEQHLEDLRSSDIERQRKAARELGIELVEEEPSYVDPYEELRTELSQVKSQLSAAEEQRAQERATQAVEARLSALELDESDKDWVLARAIALGAGDDGLPDIKSAYDQLRARDEAAMERWAASKKAPQSIAPGRTATETKDIMSMTDDERVDWAVRRLEGAGA